MDNKIKEKPTDVEVELLYSCDKCDFDSENPDDLKKHKEKNIHSQKDRSFEEIKDRLLEEELPEEIYICGECSMRFETYMDCETHTKSHDSKCYKCDFISNDKKKLENHERTEHERFKCNKQSHKGKCTKIPFENSKADKAPENIKEGVQTHTLICAKCNKAFNEEELLANHNCKVKCNQCDFLARDVSELMNHTRLTHEETIQCNFCAFETSNRGDMAKHTFEYHEDKTLLNIISDQLCEVQSG